MRRLRGVLFFMPPRLQLFLAVQAVVLSGCHSSLSSRAEFLDYDGNETRQVIEYVALPSAVAQEPQRVPTEEELEAEYGVDYSKAVIQAFSAYSEGLSGAGVMIGVLDTGLSARGHAELPRSRIRAHTYYEGLDESNPPEAFAFHGTAVASILAAERDGIGMHGVAPGAQVQLLRPSALVRNENTTITLDELRANDRALAGYMNWGLQFPIVNNSWGFAPGIAHRNCPSSGECEDVFTADALRKVLPATLGVIAQQDRDPADRTIFVWAAGNFGEQSRQSPSEPMITAGLPLRFPELEGHWLAVVSVGPSLQGNNNTTISPFSNRCGQAAAFCLAAPGGKIVAAALVPDDLPPHLLQSRGYLEMGGRFYRKLSGTSFAAPMVSGALALMMEKFPGMGNTAIVAKLLDAADNSRHLSDEETYGRGLLNIEAAISPSGTQSLYLDAEGDRRVALSTAGVGGFRLAEGTLLMDQPVMAMDETGAPFWYSLDELAPSGTTRPEEPAALSGDFSLSHWHRGSWLSGRDPTGESWLIGRLEQGSGHVFLLSGADIGRLNYVPAREQLWPTGHVAPWLEFMGKSDGAGAGFSFGRTHLSASLLRSRTDTGTIPKGREKSALVIGMGWQGTGQGLQFLAGQTEESAAVLGLQLPSGGRAKTSWLGADWTLEFANSWRLQLSAYRRKSSVGISNPVLLQQVRIAPSNSLSFSLRADGLIVTADSFSLSWSTAPDSVRGRANWRLPQSLSYRRVQFSDYSHAFHTASDHRWHLAYGLRYARTGLNAYLGEGGTGTGLWGGIGIRLSL